VHCIFEISFTKLIMKPIVVINPLQPASHASCGIASVAMRGLKLGAWLEIAGLDGQRDHRYSYANSSTEIRPEVEIV
jgi:hypothetical protein